jgi:hypothetical protein
MRERATASNRVLSLSWVRCFPHASFPKSAERGRAPRRF